MVQYHIYKNFCCLWDEGRNLLGFHDEADISFNCWNKFCNITNPIINSIFKIIWDYKIIEMYFEGAICNKYGAKNIAIWLQLKYVVSQLWKQRISFDIRYVESHMFINSYLFCSKADAEVERCFLYRLARINVWYNVLQCLSCFWSKIEKLFHPTVKEVSPELLVFYYSKSCSRLHISAANK